MLPDIHTWTKVYVQHMLGCHPLHLPSRTETHLAPHLQRRVVRAIKSARCMGLIAGEAGLEKRHVRRLREQEAREAAAAAEAAAFAAVRANAQMLAQAEPQVQAQA